jgi:hypothetical protein
MEIKISGTACPKCRSIDVFTLKVSINIMTDANVIKVKDIAEIIKFNIMRTPALVEDTDL